MHSMVHVLFPNNVAIFNDDISPYTQPEVFSCGLRSTSTSSLASTVTHLKYRQANVVSFRELGEKQIPSIISQATKRSVVEYFTRDYLVYSKKDTRYKLARA